MRKPVRGLWDCFSVSVSVAAVLSCTALLLATTTTRQLVQTRLVRSYGAAAVPELWRRLGARDAGDVARVARVASRRQVFEILVDEYLAPWSAATVGGMAAPISDELLDSMEVPLRNRTVGRVRLSTVGSVLYRVIEHWDKTYRLQRFAFFLELLTQTLKRYAPLRALPGEFYVNAADGPRVTVDSSSSSFAGLPLFGFRTEHAHIDIPVPDPVEHGAHVTGEGYVVDAEVRAKAPWWGKKKNMVVFRGSSSSILQMRHGNWFLNPRVRLSQISMRYPHIVDAGVSKWIKLANGTSVNDILGSANLTQKTPLSLREQLTYKYILDVDGGMGSSRKRWMLLSGSVPFFQESSVYQWYEPLLAPWVHYVPVDKWFRDLVKHVRWAQRNDEQAREIVHNAREFASKYLSDDAVLEYIAVLLQKYAKLMKNVRRYADPVRDACVEEPIVEVGPMGCRTDWNVYEANNKLPFGCRHKPLEYMRFVCHRKNPVTNRKEVKHGIYTSYENEYDKVWRVKRAKELEEEKAAKRAAEAIAARSGAAVA